MAGVSGRQTRIAFSKFAQNSWGAATSVTKGVFFDAETIAYRPTMSPFEAFTNSFETVSEGGEVPALDFELQQQSRYDDYSYIVTALALGSPAPPTISTSASGQTPSWQHVIDAASVIDGLGLTLAIDKVQYVEELTSVKVHGFSTKNGTGGIMTTAYQLVGSMPTIISSVNTQARVAAAIMPGLGNRVFRKHGVFRMNVQSAGSLIASDAVHAVDLAFSVDRPQDAHQVFAQDFTDEPTDDAHPIFGLSITYPRMNTLSANSLRTALQAGNVFKADLTFTGTLINSTDAYRDVWQWPSLQVTEFSAPVERAGQIRPRAVFKANTPPAGVTGMSSVTGPMRVTRTSTIPIWAFASDALATPNSPWPADGATNIDRDPLFIGWQGTGALYDVYFGTSNPPPLVSSNQPVSSTQPNRLYAPGLLSATTTYFWKIVAKNFAESASGPVWSFTTGTAIGDSVNVLTTTSTGTQNDFNPGVLGNISLLRANNASLLTLTGLTNNGSTPTDGQLLYVESVGAGQVDIKNQNTGSSATNRVINNVTGTISLAPGVGRALLVYDGTTGRWRVVEHEQGDWTDVPYAAGNFSTQLGSTMTWTVESGDQLTFKYYLRGKMLTVAVIVNLTSLTGTQDGTGLWITVPGGFTEGPTQISAAAGYLYDNGTYRRARVSTVAGGGSTTMIVESLDGLLALSTNNTGLGFEFSFQVQ
jgi:hypothetical protein